MEIAIVIALYMGNVADKEFQRTGKKPFFLMLQKIIDCDEDKMSISGELWNAVFDML